MSVLYGNDYICKLKEKEDDMRETGEERELVPMKVNGLGSATTSPETMVILLTPMEEDKYKLPNGNHMIYPVGVPPEMGPIYFNILTQLFLQKERADELTHYFELISGSTLQALHIYQGNRGPRPYMIFVDKAGEENSFRVPLPNGILSALSHQIPILIERKLLLSVANVVRINSDDTAIELNATKGEGSLYKSVEKHITKGMKPAELPATHVLEAIRHFTEDERSTLMNLAVEYENYEWAALLNDL